jgi:ribonuclease-3
MNTAKIIQKRVMFPRYPKVRSPKSGEWCQEKKIFHYDIYEDNGIDGTVSS